MSNIEDILNIDASSAFKSYKKGSILLHQGDITTSAYYVKKGLLRSYTIDEKGKEHIFMFAPEGWIIADIESHEFNQPAELYIDCIENSEVVAFNRKSQSTSNLSSTQLLEQINLFSRRIAVLQRRMILMMSAPAIERYAYFMETYPKLSNRIPQRMIASYLGVTPEALSKLKGKSVRSK